MNLKQFQILVFTKDGQIRDTWIWTCRSFQKLQLGERVREIPSIMSHVVTLNLQTSTRGTLHSFTKTLVFWQLVVFQSKNRCGKKTAKAARDVTVNVYPHLIRSTRNMMIMDCHRNEPLIQLICWGARQKKITKTRSKESRIESSTSLKNNKSIRIKLRELMKKQNVKMQLSSKN